MDAVKQEMSNVMIAFEEVESPESLVGYQQITGHLVFDVKLGEGFRRKARYCADGHKTKPPASVTYSTVVSRDSVRIALTIAALNELDVQGADVQNAFLNAENAEKVWLRAGPEFGDLQDKCFIVRRALYGLKSAGYSFRSFIAKQLDEMGFVSCIADPDVWRRPAIKDNGERYYEYLLTYVDDLIAVSCDAVAILKQIAQVAKLKKDEIKPPEDYLGATLKRCVKDNVQLWTISSQKYVKASISNVEERLKSRSQRLPSNARTPMVQSYVPELDVTSELDKDEMLRNSELMALMFLLYTLLFSNS